MTAASLTLRNGDWSALGRGGRRALREHTYRTENRRTYAANSQYIHHILLGVSKFCKLVAHDSHPAYRFAVTVSILTGSFPG